MFGGKKKSWELGKKSKITNPVGLVGVHVRLLVFALERCFPGGSDGKESPCNAEDPGSIPGSERSPGEWNGYPLQILAWRIPWTEEPGGLQSIEAQSQTQLSD